MTTLDFRLRHLLDSLPGKARVHALLQYRSNLASLEELGFRTTSVAGDVAAGSISIDALEELSLHEEVIRVGGVRSLKDEMDVSSVAINLVDPIANRRKIRTLGSGAMIGLIDSGFELTHPAFRDAQGKTRVLAAWDQLDLDKVGTPRPDGLDYGIEYTKEVIDREIANNRILTIKNHPDAGSHGTYVAGIAAGDGYPDNIYTGVAPEANLILVAYRNDTPVGGSAFFLDAIKYIQEKARQHGRAVVINVSQGDNLGAHDGTSLLERAIDNLVREGRILIVTSAGNERGESVGHHAEGDVKSGQELVVPFSLMLDAKHPVDDDTMELWYRGSDRFAVALKPPQGRISDFVVAGESAVIEFPGGNTAYVYSETDHPANKDNHIGIILQKSDGWEGGNWELILRGDTVHDGHFDVWSDRPNAVTVIGFMGNKSDASTVTLPGNAELAITVGSYVSRREQRPNTNQVTGDIAPGSSIGPTRDNRIKPDLAAPGSLIMAPRIRTDQCPVSYDMQSGTSMAAPHVTGIIALFWALWPGLRAERIRAALIRTAGKDQFTGATPNQMWGAGKVDAEQAYKALSNLLKTGETNMENLTVFEFQMSPQPKPDGHLAGMAIRIVADNGESIVVTGVSEGVQYEGHLVLRRKRSNDAKVDNVGENEEEEDDHGEGGDEGGDECYINGVWHNPCPPGGRPVQ